MTKAMIHSEMREILNRVRWQEGRDGAICIETRFSACRALLGLANKAGDNALKSAVMKAYNWLGKVA